MSDTLSRIRKRRKFPVELGEEKVFVRALTYDETERMEAMTGDIRTGFVIGCGLLNDDGEPEFLQAAEESDSDFANRVLAASKDIDMLTLFQVVEAIGKVGAGDPEAIRKN